MEFRNNFRIINLKGQPDISSISNSRCSLLRDNLNWNSYWEKIISGDETLCIVNKETNNFPVYKKGNRILWSEKLAQPRCKLQCVQCTLVIIQLRRINDGALRIVLIKLLRIADKSPGSVWFLLQNIEFNILRSFIPSMGRDEDWNNCRKTRGRWSSIRSRHTRYSAKLLHSHRCDVGSIPIDHSVKILLSKTTINSGISS